MTTKFSRRTQCRDKVRYPSKRAAKRAARSLEAWYGKRFRGYRCPHCDLHHLGTPHHEKEAPVKGDIEVYKFHNDDEWGWDVRLDDLPDGEAISGFAESEQQALEQAEQARKDELGT